MKPLLAVLMLLFAAGGAEQKHRYIFVYTVGVFNPNESHAMYCPNNPHCNDVYNAEERHQWFDTLAEALEGMNRYEHPSRWAGTGQFATTSGFGIVTHAGTSDYNGKGEVIGLYEVTQVPAKLVKTGTEKHPVQKTVEEDVPVMEWQVKP